MSGLLLDTNAFIRIVLGTPVRDEAKNAVVEAALASDLWVSAVSAWEIGMLVTAPRTGAQLMIQNDPFAWFEQARSKMNAQNLPLAAEQALRASFLPEPFHKDPADRLLVSQARTNGLTLVTRDQAILAYAASGHVRAIAC